MCLLHLSYNYASKLIVCSPLNTNRSILLLFSYCADDGIVISSVTLHRSLLALCFLYHFLPLYLFLYYLSSSCSPFSIAIHFFLLSSPAINLLSPTLSLYHYKVSFDGFVGVPQQETTASPLHCVPEVHVPPDSVEQSSEHCYFYWSHAVGSHGGLE